MLETIAYFTIIIFIAKFFLFMIVGIIILLLDILLDYYLDLKNKKRIIVYDMVIYFLLGSIASVIFNYF